MEKQPKFIKEFSKQQSSEERGVLAKELVAKRSESRAANIEADAHEKKLQEQLASIQGLETKIEDLSENGVSRLRNYFKLRALHAQLGMEQGVHADASKVEVVRPDMAEAKRMVDDFYADQKKEWANSPYSKEDIEKNFSEEHLASLSLEEYALLMKRFPKEMVTHTTRQGIRERVAGHGMHNKGYGEFHNGFVAIVEDGRLRSNLAISMVEIEKGKALGEFLKLDQFDSKEDALRALDRLTGTKEYADRMALHFATQLVADANYGAEAGNEIFFTFPSALIASQYYFQGRLTHFVEERDRGQLENDQFVWANEEKGVDINAGLVFISGDARVDPVTGSQYVLGPDKRPVLKERLFYALENLLEADIFCRWAKEHDAATIMARGSEKEKESLRESFERQFFSYTDEMKSVILSFDFLDRATRNVELFDWIEQQRERGEDATETRRRIRHSSRHDVESNILGPRQLLYERASNTISSKEYWEQYFAQHTDKKPSKIVYYDGGDPTKALRKWQADNGIEKWSADDESFHMGFEERWTKNRGEAPEPVLEGRDRFKSIAEKVIDDYYDRKSLPLETTK